MGFDGQIMAITMITLYLSAFVAMVGGSIRIFRKTNDVPHLKAVGYFLVALAPFCAVRATVFIVGVLITTVDRHGDPLSAGFLALWGSPNSMSELIEPPSRAVFNTMWVLWTLGIWLFFAVKTSVVLAWAFLVESYGKDADVIATRLKWICIGVNGSMFVTLVISNVMVCTVYSQVYDSRDFTSSRLNFWFAECTSISGIWTFGATLTFCIYGVRLHRLHTRILSSSSSSSNAGMHRSFVLIVAAVSMLSFALQTVVYALDSWSIAFQNQIADRPTRWVCGMVMITEVFPTIVVFVLLHVRVRDESSRARERQESLLNGKDAPKQATRSTHELGLTADAVPRSSNLYATPAP